MARKVKHVDGQLRVHRAVQLRAGRFLIRRRFSGLAERPRVVHADDLRSALARCRCREVRRGPPRSLRPSATCAVNHRVGGYTDRDRLQAMTTALSAPRPLLVLDSDLGRKLSSEQTRMANRALTARTVTLPAGSWDPQELLSAVAAGLGLLILDGAIARELWLRDVPSTELFGPGEIIAVVDDGVEELLQPAVRWSALAPSSLALLDEHAVRALALFPEAMAVVLERLAARAERLAITQAVSHMTGVDARVEVMLWHLAARWGRVGREGMIVPLALSHRMIGSLVGARRPTVTAAITRLTRQKRLQR